MQFYSRISHKNIPRIHLDDKIVIWAVTFLREYCFNIRGGKKVLILHGKRWFTARTVINVRGGELSEREKKIGIYPLWILPSNKMENIPNDQSVVLCMHHVDSSQHGHLLSTHLVAWGRSTRYLLFTGHLGVGGAYYETPPGFVPISLIFASICEGQKLRTSLQNKCHVVRSKTDVWWEQNCNICEKYWSM